MHFSFLSLIHSQSLLHTSPTLLRFFLYFLGDFIFKAIVVSFDLEGENCQEIHLFSRLLCFPTFSIIFSLVTCFPTLFSLCFITEADISLLFCQVIIHFFPLFPLIFASVLHRQL